MEVRTELQTDRTIRNTVFANDDGVRERLETLLAINAGIADDKALFRTERERLEAAVMANPIAPEKAFSFFGLIIGALVPATVFGRLLWDNGGVRPDNSWVLIFIVLINFTAAIVGFITGKPVGRSVARIHGLSISKSILLLPLLGLVWGLVVGAASGVSCIYRRRVLRSSGWRHGRCGCFAGVCSSSQVNETR